MKKIARVLIGWSSVFMSLLNRVFADDSQTNVVATLIPRDDRTFLGIYETELQKRGTAVFFDRLGPPSMQKWTTSSMNHGYEFHQVYIDSGADVMKSAFVYSFQETITHFSVWSGLMDRSEYLNNLIVGTIANTSERRLDTLSPGPTAAQDYLWRQMRDDGNIQYGFRPLSSNPYVYVSSRWGHWNNEPLAYTLFRCHYDPIHLRPKMDGLLTVNAPFRSQMKIGASFDPTATDSARSDLSLSAGFSHTLGKKLMDGSVFVSVFVDQDRNKTLFVGFHIPL